MVRLQETPPYLPPCSSLSLSREGMSAQPYSTILSLYWSAVNSQITRVTMLRDLDNDLQSGFPCCLLPLIEANETLPVQCMLVGPFGVDD